MAEAVKKYCSSERSESKTIDPSKNFSADKSASKNIVRAESRTITLHLPPIELTTGNVAMIGIAAGYQLATRSFSEGWDQKTTWDKISVNANLKL